MLKCRVTQIEAFRRFIEGEPYSTEESLIESWSGIFKGNEYTRIGTGFHLLVEKGNITNFNELKIDGIPITYNFQQIETAQDYKAEISPCFHEIRMNKVYNIEREQVEVSGACDALKGLLIRDIKTKYSDLRSIEDYTRSYQWRLYCDIFNVPDFTFDVFQFVGYDKDRDGYDVSCLQMKRHDPIECMAYHKMSDDIHYLLYQLVEYIRYKRLEHLFTVNALKLEPINC